MDKEIRDKYFGNNWHPNWDHYDYSGWALIDKINADETILDVGCGFNLFKDKGCCFIKTLCRGTLFFLITLSIQFSLSLSASLVKINST